MGLGIWKVGSASYRERKLQKKTEFRGTGSPCNIRCTGGVVRHAESVKLADECTGLELRGLD